MDEFVNACKNVVDSEGIKAELKDIEKLCRDLYPDLRRTINEIQKCSVSGEFSLPDKTSNENIVKALFELIKSGHVLKARKMIIQNEVSFNSDYTELLKTLFNYIDNLNIKTGKRKALLTVSEYMYRMSFVMDPEINFYSCIIAVSNIFKPN
tara:strand:- start:104 stop:559 length:456 start_codon:yes stop_codon:yes gene_type:complete